LKSLLLEGECCHTSIILPDATRNRFVEFDLYRIEDGTAHWEEELTVNITYARSFQKVAESCIFADGRLLGIKMPNGAALDSVRSFLEASYRNDLKVSPVSEQIWDQFVSKSRLLSWVSWIVSAFGQSEHSIDERGMPRYHPAQFVALALEQSGVLSQKRDGFNARTISDEELYRLLLRNPSCFNISLAKYEKLWLRRIAMSGEEE
jgi:hypothetical protein